MIAELTPKQSAEAYFISFVFDDVVGTGETISSATVVALDMADDSVVTATVTDAVKQTIASAIIYVWVKAGTDAHNYRITCTATSSLSAVYELEAILPVRNIPATPPSMGTGLVTAPAMEPITLEEAKAHLLIDTDTSAADHEIMDMVKAARLYVEDYTRRAILTQTWDYTLPGWPTSDFIMLPMGNLQSVTSIKWKDEDATETTLAVTTDYLVQQNGTLCGKIVLPYATPWPSGTLYPVNPITIRYVCGWAAPELVPMTIRMAIKMILADLYENRSTQEYGNMGFAGSRTVDNLLASQRLWM